MEKEIKKMPVDIEGANEEEQNINPYLINKYIYMRYYLFQEKGVVAHEAARTLFLPRRFHL